MIKKLKALKKYFVQATQEKHPKKAEILQNSEALKHLGTAWSKYKPEIMTLMTIAEYEYISDNEFTKSEINAVKEIVGKICIQFAECEQEYEEFEKMQEQKAKKS